MRVLAGAYHQGKPSAEADAEAEGLQRAAERARWPVVAAWTQFVRGEVRLAAQPERAEPLLLEALRRARALDERYLTGVTLVSASSARLRHGDPAASVDLFVGVVRHWRDRGDGTYQWTTLRNVVERLVGLDRRMPAAVLALALAARGPDGTGFGSDAERLAATTAALLDGHSAAERDDLVAQADTLDDRALLAFVLAALTPPDGRTGRS